MKKLMKKLDIKARLANKNGRKDPKNTTANFPDLIKRE
jgi:hypothetical protein